jgi:hypothetical protein
MAAPASYPGLGTMAGEMGRAAGQTGAVAANRDIGSAAQQMTSGIEKARANQMADLAQSLWNSRAGASKQAFWPKQLAANVLSSGIA